jgi:hypothetical protein
MLPPSLAQLKRILEAKGYSARTAGEDRLLEELDLLDKDPAVERSVKSVTFSETRITAGPGVCPCCQR